MNVLSLFDGISCGQVALERAGIKYDKYYASEIDKNAIKITMKNYPNTIQLGDVTKWREWDIDWSSIDLLIGGSPCQGFSFAGKQLNFNDPRSKLFFEYVDILRHIQKVNPSVKFLLENVKMKKEYQDVITNALHQVPVFINSRKVSAQDRKRLYWENWHFTNPKDKNISVSDIIGENCFAGAMRGRRIDENGKRADYRKELPIIQQIECRKDNKTNCVTTVSKDNVVVFSKEKFFSALLNKEKWRYLTPEETEQLQTLPIGYTSGISDSSRISAIGNGWTVDVIAHIFRFLPYSR
jgi:Site-specific DNA methylase